jgi:MFS family permease
VSPLRARGTHSAGFWLVVLAATANYTVLAATAPLVARAAPDLLGASESASGALVSVTGLTGALCMTLVGVAAGRFGPRVVTLASALVAVLAIGALVAVFTTPSVAAARVLYGIGNAGITVATTAWVSATSPPGERGRTFGYYGVSVWVGLALGPLLAENVYATRGNVAAWTVLLAVQALVLVAVSAVAAPRRGEDLAPSGATGAAPGRRARQVLAVLWVPSLVALTAWGAQGLFTTFLVQHLEGRGLASTGVLGASSIFLVFAASVVAARFAMGSLPDRLGPLVATRGALVVVAAGLGVMAVSTSFGVAALGAVVLGVGYAPLYPSLTLLSTTALPDAQRPTGIGLFSAATSLGMAAGAAGGGALIQSSGSVTALLCAASAQLLVLPALRFARGGAPVGDAVRAVEPSRP